VSGDLDALDRGVIEAGRMAAEALSRIGELEQQVGSLMDALAIIGAIPGRKVPTRKYRHLEVVKGGAPL
jgi:hypothetical protein